MAPLAMASPFVAPGLGMTMGSSTPKRSTPTAGRAGHFLCKVTAPAATFSLSRPELAAAAEEEVALAA